jgi:branched-chain amino acid transport system permease protein
MLYVLIALGFSMIYGIMRVVNFAHGHLYMLGGLLTYGITASFGLNFVASLLISTIAVGLLGIMLEKMIFSPLKANEFASVVSAIGVAIFLGGIVEVIMGGEIRGVESPWGGVIQIGDVFLIGDRLMVFGVALGVVLVFYIYLRYTKFGRATRATVDDSEMASAYGIKVVWVYRINFGLAAALAGIAGGLVAPITGVSSGMGFPAMLKAFIAVILGGLGSITGVVVGGLFLGFFESTVTTLISSEMSEMIIFLVVLIVLIFKPSGLLGRA